MKRPSFEISDQSVAPGRRAQVEFPIARLMSGTPVALPVQVVHGTSEGPTIWLSAVLHGDELCGVEIIRQVLTTIDAKELKGTVIAIPVANVHGFNTGDRYLPDRRDLNRAFPGSPRGPLASRVANLIMTEVISRSALGIDLHTGSDHRINLPQIRGDLQDPTVLELAQVFGAPVSLHSRVRDGSLREAATEAGATALLFEGGEADRFDRAAIAAGKTGCLRVMQHLEMIEDAPDATASTRLSRSSKWMRASRSGILHLDVQLGQEVGEGEPVATIYDPFGKRLGVVKSRTGGVVIGHGQRPLVNRGDAIVHVAEVE